MTKRRTVLLGGAAGAGLLTLACAGPGTAPAQPAGRRAPVRLSGGQG